jgi:hypothetical protein
LPAGPSSPIVESSIEVDREHVGDPLAHLLYLAVDDLVVAGEGQIDVMAELVRDHIVLVAAQRREEDALQEEGVEADSAVGVAGDRDALPAVVRLPVV